MDLVGLNRRKALTSSPVSMGDRETPVVPLLTLGKRRGFLLSKRYKTRRYLAIGGFRYAVPFGLTKGAT